MAYIGREPQIGNYQVCDAISVVNAQAAYTMQVNSVNVLPESVNHMIVSLNGVIQNPGGDNPSYTISGATITFSSNLATGDSIDFIYLLGNVLDLGTPSDDTVTGAKIVDNAINSEHYTDGSIDLAHLSADSVDGSKIADNAINSEHYTDGSIDTAHIGADQITNAKIADDQIDSEHYVDGSIDTAHIADGQVTTAKLATAVFTGATDIGAAIADADLILLDDGAGGTIRKSTASRIKTYIGNNTPAFSAAINGNQNIGNNSATTIAFANELFDTGSDFNNSNYKWTVPETGKYLVNIRAAFEGSADFFAALSLVKDNTGDIFAITQSHDNTNDMLTGSIIATFGANHVYYVTAHQTSGSTVALIGNHQHSEFSVFKLSGV